ncbi:hypothetical protein NDU88_002759 [Pleurodeles waltl]|uniref:Uncharacterized protein n=1 Tax=Pleurodeles waltl TaxID=8319 RepID=A0AAV7KX11_PLEWA|nr:hypothetical protein NDU88_002759 [Pleurodeles waltl]
MILFESGAATDLLQAHAQEVRAHAAMEEPAPTEALMAVAAACVDQKGNVCISTLDSNTVAARELSKELQNNIFQEDPVQAAAAVPDIQA